MEKIQVQLKQLESQLYHREEVVIGKGDQLKGQVKVQDVKVKKVCAAYKAMGLADEAQIRAIIGKFLDQNNELLEGKSFWKKYEEINDQLNELLSLLASPNNQKEVISQAEKVVVDMNIVLQSYWETMASRLKRVCDFISICKYSEYLTIVGLERWEARQKVHEQPISVRNRLMTEKMEHIKDQLGLLSKEEVILQEMQLNCNERERVYEISKSLFLG